MNCDDCGSVYEHHLPPTVVDELDTLPARFSERLLGGATRQDRSAVLRRRPASEVWSALEYACHVRDVLLAQRERLLLMLVEDRPSFAKIHRDERVALAGYALEEPRDVAHQIEVATQMFVHVLRGVDDLGWRREALYNYPEPTYRPASWLAAHTLHEGEHHLRDIDTVLRRVLDVR